MNNAGENRTAAEELDRVLIELAEKTSWLALVLSRCSDASEGAHLSQSDKSRTADAATDRLIATARKASKLRAMTFDGIVAKAQILAEFCQEPDADLRCALAASLCDDIRWLDLSNEDVAL